MKSFCLLTLGEEGLHNAICISSFLPPLSHSPHLPSLSCLSHHCYSFDTPQIPPFSNLRSPPEPKLPCLAIPGLLYPHFPAMSCFPRSLLSPSFFSLLFTHSSHCLTPSPTNPQTSVVPSTPPNFSNTSPFLLNVFPSRLLLASV